MYGTDSLHKNVLNNNKNMIQILYITPMPFFRESIAYNTAQFFWHVRLRLLVAYETVGRTNMKLDTINHYMQVKVMRNS